MYEVITINNRNEKVVVKTTNTAEEAIEYVNAVLDYCATSMTYYRVAVKW